MNKLTKNRTMHEELQRQLVVKASESMHTWRIVEQRVTFCGLIPAAATYMSSFPIGIPIP